jgi:hypothetical protein
MAAKPVPNLHHVYSVPLSFEKNQGQANSSVRFLSRGNGYSLFLTGAEAVLSLNRGNSASALLTMSFPGSNANPAAEALAPQEGVSHYYNGQDRSKWITGVRHYGRVQYRGMYPGIDVAYYGNQRQLEYDFIVAPRADASQVRMRFSGAEKLLVNEAGELVIRTATGDVVQRAPVAYQEANGSRQYVRAHYVLRGKNEAAFELAQYDRSRRLVIDPVLVYSTYIGGAGADLGTGVAVMPDGTAYLTGTSTGTLVAGGRPFAGGPNDTFIAKYSPAGGLAYAAFRW